MAADFINQPVSTTLSPIVMATSVVGPTPISDSLSASLNKAMTSIPGGKTGYLEASLTLTGAELSIGHKLTTKWTVGGWGGIDWSGHKAAGVRLRGSW